MKKNKLRIIAALPGNFLSILSIMFLLVFASCDKDDDDDMDNKNVDLKLIADGFVSPLGVVAVPDNSNRLFVIDQPGKIWVLDGTGAKLPTPFLDLSTSLVTLNAGYDERGLLGFAFHPQFTSNHRVFAYYQVPAHPGGPAAGVNWNNLSRISEFKTVAGNDNLADKASEKVIMEWDDPQSNHNGGTIAFGPDGYLYISLGDGGAADDVAPGHVTDWYLPNAGGNGQDLDANLFGSVLRIDINNGSPYGIPADNPFVSGPGKDEIFAYGFRNPYRMSFDMGGSRELYLGDAGQVLYEEINRVTMGGNYGWNVKEGKICFNAANNKAPLASCPAVDNFGKPLIDPVIVINNAANPAGGKALTVIGGNVYRGSEIPSFNGKYIFGTFAQPGNVPNGELFIAQVNGQSDWKFEELTLVSNPNDIGYYLKGFGQDTKGELYLTVSSTLGPGGTTGKVFKLVLAK